MKEIMTALPALAPTPTKLSSTWANGMHVTTVEHGSYKEFHLTVVPQPGEPLAGMYERLQHFLNENGAVIARQQVFGRGKLQVDGIKLMTVCLGNISWPLTWLEGNGSGHEIAGMHLLAVTGVEVEPVVHRGTVIGASFDDGFGRHLMLGHLAPDECFCSAAAQTRQVYELLESTLSGFGMDLQNVVRTWLFLDEICSWYGDLNNVRNLVYARQGLKKLPASTGVGVGNPKRTKLIAEAWAMQPLAKDVVVREIESPLQCAAPKYGSGFSRATEVSTPAWRRLTISGTASIAPDGSSVHDGDIDAQIQLTMEVIETILKSRGLSLDDTSRMTAYFKNIEQVPHFERWLKANGIGSLPLVMAEADICRPELLFEVEMDAISSGRGD
jgi:enamine deaminase RidA (YjgF/YER057c/UK114 family)